MHLLTMRELDQASSDAQGICLECGLVQDFAERESMRFGLCLDCETQRVLLAKACHTTKSYIWHLEHGDSTRIGLEMAACLCRFFGIDLCEFAGRSGETPPSFR